MTSNLATARNNNALAGFAKLAKNARTGTRGFPGAIARHVVPLTWLLLETEMAGFKRKERSTKWLRAVKS